MIKNIVVRGGATCMYIANKYIKKNSIFTVITTILKIL
jgi:hypothetical protein